MFVHQFEMNPGDEDNGWQSLQAAVPKASNTGPLSPVHPLLTRLQVPTQTVVLPVVIWF